MPRIDFHSKLIKNYIENRMGNSNLGIEWLTIKQVLEISFN